MVDSVRQVITSAQIKTELDKRGDDHRLSIIAASETIAATGKTPLAFLAQGDSWFDYPLGGTLFAPRTDAMQQLGGMGAPNPKILSVAHWGLTSTDELSMSKQQRMITELANQGNWFTGKPDAILFSGGGNDIAGEQFLIYLNRAPAADPLNDARMQLAIEGIKSSYLALFDFRDQFAPGVPIFGHDYDFAIPNGVPACMGIGPWLQPSLEEAGWLDLAVGSATVKAAMQAFGKMLADLESDVANNFTLVRTQGTLVGPADWANELHPTPTGFGKVATQFLGALRTKFHGAI